MNLILNPKTCVKKDIENCLTYLNSQFCSECQLGYYVKEGVCVNNPPEMIENCAKYLNEASCKSCIEGYYLKSSTECE